MGNGYGSRLIKTKYAPNHADKYYIRTNCPYWTILKEQTDNTDDDKYETSINLLIRALTLRIKKTLLEDILGRFYPIM